MDSAPTGLSDVESSGPILPQSQYFTLQQVAEGVYAAIVVPGTGAWGNAGIVDLGDRTLVFDTFATPRAASDLRVVAEELTGRPVSWVVNSHNHLDHVFGNEVFTEASIVATAKTHELIAVRGPAFIEQAKSSPEFLDELQAQIDQETDERKRKELAETLGEYRAIHGALSTLKLRLPNLTFEERMVFHGSRRVAHLVSYGGGHTPSDAFLYLPMDKVVFTGDLVQVGFHPMMSQGDPEEWDFYLEQVGRLEVEHLVPGHGPVGNMWDIVRTRQYLTDLQNLTVEVHHNGMSLELVDMLPIPTQYSHWESPSTFTANIHYLYERIPPESVIEDSADMPQDRYPDEVRG
jgi:glyoxylase-like metal-dependent hydrolase (beta-lactamase superfamily II)